MNIRGIIAAALVVAFIFGSEVHAYPVAGAAEKHEDIFKEVNHEAKLKAVIAASRKRVKAAKEERERKDKEEKLTALKSENPSYFYIEYEGYDRLGRALDPYNTCGASNWTGPELTQKIGIISLSSGQKFTYYNQPMGGCFRLHSEEIAPYSIADTWISDKGIKMVGPYVMCAAYTPWFPPGTLVNTPFGMGMVVDYNGHCDLPGGTKADIDICTTWGKEVPN